MSNVIDATVQFEQRRTLTAMEVGRSVTDILNNQHAELNECVYQNKESAYNGTTADLLKTYFGGQGKNRSAE